MHGLLVFALIGAVVNYMINLIYFLIGKRRYRTYMKILMGDDNINDSIFGFSSKNSGTGIFIVLALVFIIFLIAELKK